MVPFRSGVIYREGGGRAQFEVGNADGRGAVVGSTVDLEDQQVLTERIALCECLCCQQAPEQICCVTANNSQVTTRN